MENHSILFVGLDTHKEFVEVAYIEDQRGFKPVLHERVSIAKVSIKKLAKQFYSKYPSATLHFVYESGHCGYWIYRLLTSLGRCSYVVAPSLIPEKQRNRETEKQRNSHEGFKKCEIPTKSPPFKKHYLILWYR